jgi:hypothetical protein
MAEVAILKMVILSRFCDFQTQHVCLSLCTKFHQNRMVIAHFTARTSISNMAAILKGVGNLRFCIYDFGSVSRTYLSNFIGIR